MRLWVSLGLLLGSLVACTASSGGQSVEVGAGENLPADRTTGKKLLAEGDALADKGNTTEAVISYKRAFEQLLPGMRRLPFKHEVNRDVTAREDLKAML